MYTKLQVQGNTLSNDKIMSTWAVHFPWDMQDKTTI